MRLARNLAAILFFVSLLVGHPRAGSVRELCVEPDINQTCSTQSAWECNEQDSTCGLNFESWEMSQATADAVCDLYAEECPCRSGSAYVDRCYWWCQYEEC
jgi:hypothetical protein